MLALTVALTALAARPPPLQGMVVDPAGVLSAAERTTLEQRLDRLRKETGFAVVVFFPASLEGETIEDYAYETFNQWGVGEKGEDNGVLLVLAPRERKVRIETGKGVGGELTDIQSGRILRAYVTPHMKKREYFLAALEGSNAITEALTKRASDSDAQAQDDTEPEDALERTASSPYAGLLFTGGFFVLLVFLILLSGMRGQRSHSRWWSGGGGGFGGGWGGGGFGGGGGGGGGYSGGGGSSGGGGASDSY